MIVALQAPEGPALEFLVLFLVVLVGPALMSRARLPGIIGLLLGGWAIGPHGLGLIGEGNHTIPELGQFGLLYLMFVAGLELDNQVTSAGRNSGDNAYIYGRPYEYRRVVRGTIPAGGGTFTIKGSVPDAPLLAAQLLTDYLRRHGIGVDQSASTYVPDPSRDFARTPLLTLLSPTVQEIVQRANQKSVNLYCEALLLAIGKKYRDEGSRSAGIEAIKAVWSERGLDLSEAKLLDGSGLSWGNRLSGYQLATLLRKIDRDPTISGIFRQSLAVAGRSGTLQDAMRGTLAEGRITAKTGSMKKVRSYSGFAETRSGQQLAFSIIVNNYPCSSWQIRRKLEELMAAFCR